MIKALTETQAEEARLLRAKGKSYGEIGRTYNVHPSTAENACKRSGAYRYGGQVKKENT